MIEVSGMDTRAVVGLWKLPDGWEWVHLGTAFSLRVGTLDPSKVPDEIFSLYSMPSYDAGAGPEIVYGREIGSAKILVQKGDILLSKLNPRIPRIWDIQEDTPRRKLASTDFLALIVKSNSSHEPYFDGNLARYLLLSDTFRSQVGQDIKGATNSRQRLNRGDILNALVPRPPLDIQRRMVRRIESLLVDLREAQTTLENMCKDIDQVMDSSLFEIFAHTRNGFEVVNVPPEEIKDITNVAQIERGKFTPRPRNDPRFFGGSIPWVQIQNLPKDKGEKYIASYMNTLNELGLSVSKKFLKGTLVLSIAATIGAVGILTFDACFPDSLVGITPISDFIDSGFLYWQLVFIQEYLEKIAPSAAQKNINLKILEQIKLWVPSPTTQALINAHLDSIQEGIAHLYRMTEEDKEILQQVEQSVLERAFRGEL